ncbi:hypothetical protein GGI23_004744 [Coemansia sp. RSA 2559]|nr:hypothetical protein GGI23_004744 [Coemansia sp. RSA 2559]KAJ2858785.1 hypothetical protein GGI22_003235 [Coemansia erecta]
MLQLNYNDVIQYAFPALLLAAFAYVAKDWVANQLAARRRSKLNSREMARRRVLPLQKKDEPIEKAPSDQKQSPDTAEFSVKPQAPKPTNVPFGSQNMTMSDLRSRVTRDYSSACSYGSCCG